MKLALQRRRDAEKKRAARAAAKANGANSSNGIAETVPAPAKVTPAEVWQHAELISPKAPWKAFRDFGILDAVSLDAFRLNKLPPGLSTDNITKFLALSAS
jgi:hypothetical protein